MDSIIIKGFVKEAVIRTEAELKKDSGWTRNITFLHGHPLEIVQTLMEYDKSKTFKDKKYPLIALFHDFKETMAPRTGIYADVNLNIIIANFTMAEYKAPKRYDVNFIPILYPIYRVFIQMLVSHHLFIGYSVKHDKYDRLFWGKNGLYGKEGNIFNDRIDAIELQNLKLSVTNKTCSKWNLI